MLNPSTPASALEDVAGDVDFVLVMSVNPGFGGQAFIPHSLEKIRRVRAVLDRRGLARRPSRSTAAWTPSNIAAVVAAGARILVAGHAIFGTADPEAATRALRARPIRPLAQRVSTTPTDRRHAGHACASATPTPTRWASSTTPTTSSGSRSAAPNGCASRAGPTGRWKTQGVSLPVIEAHCEYRQPARYDDEIEIRTRATLLTPVRIRFDYEVVRVADGDRRRPPGTPSMPR